MAVIAVVNQKGGSGKSTTVVHFAEWLLRKGHKVMVIDADAQQSSSIWFGLMNEPVPWKVMGSPDDLLEHLPMLAAECDHLIVDGPAGLSEATRAIMFRSDIALVP
jgi:chromosome partitioning protein